MKNVEDIRKLLAKETKRRKQKDDKENVKQQPKQIIKKQHVYYKCMKQKL